MNDVSDYNSNIVIFGIAGTIMGYSLQYVIDPSS